MKKNLCGLFTLAVLVLASPVHADESRLLTGDANNNFFQNDGLPLDITADGKIVLFYSTTPVSGTAAGIVGQGLYVRNLVSNTLAYTGLNDASTAEGSISDDGRYIAYTTVNNTISWHDRQANVTRAITTTSNGVSRRPIISADGRYVAFASQSRNLVATNLLQLNGRYGAYVYDSQSQTTKIASLTYDGKALLTGVGGATTGEFTMSADGRYIFFSTDSSNVTPERASSPNSQAWFWLYRRNLSNGVVDVVCRNATNTVPQGNFTSPVVSSNGNRVLFVGSFIGYLGGPVLYSNYVGGLVSDLYLKDMTSSNVWWVTQTTNSTPPDGALSAYSMSLSGNGQVAAFGAIGEKFVTGQTDPPGGTTVKYDVYRVQINTNGTTTTTLATKAYYGTNNVSFIGWTMLPYDGSYVAFDSKEQFELAGKGDVSSIWVYGFGVGTLPQVAQPAGAPNMKFAISGSLFMISWPTTAGINLYLKTNITDATWTLVTNNVVQAGGTNSVTLSATGLGRFFNLRSAP